MPARAVKRYAEMKPVSISGVCRLPGISRQCYYRAVWSEDRSRRKATKVVAMVSSVRGVHTTDRRQEAIPCSWRRVKGDGHGQGQVVRHPSGLTACL